MPGYFSASFTCLNMKYVVLFCFVFHRQGHWQGFFGFELFGLISIKMGGIKKRKEKGLQESEKFCFVFTWLLFDLLIGLRKMFFVIISMGTTDSVHGLNITNTQDFSFRLPVLK